jgi:hypothetical protein
MKTRVERLREKHDDIVKQYDRTMAKRDEAIGVLARMETKATVLKRAVDRSKKRLKQAIADELPKSVPLSKLKDTPIGKTNAKSWDAIPAVRKAKPRRTVDDFKAEMSAKKTAANPEAGDR